MSFDLQSDMDNIFLKSGFEETVVYWSSATVSKQISAIVHRSGIESAGSAGKTKVRQYGLTVEFSTGDISEVLINEHEISVAPKRGDVARKYLVAGIISTDSGCYHVGLV